jgi:hypothetical protein
MAHIPKPQGPHNNMGMLTVAYHVGLHGATQKNMGCLCINGLNVSTNTFGTGWWHYMGVLFVTKHAFMPQMETVIHVPLPVYG